ncbi:MAG: prepilin-type N-terminal cleavage/methylation domain-containing protein [Candidatus Omnitrophica bacterium]|nr:prepilin-type N-terminal cleavage/methylation domain-containing protein [Candidatus Omnitrophota bacterium]
MRKSFTLLEVMLALSIVSVCLITVLRAYTMIVKAQASSINYTNAMYLCKQKLSELRILDPATIAKEGGFNEPFEKFSYKLAIKKGSFNDSSGVDLSIFWQEESQKKEYKVNSAIPKYGLN